MRRFFAIVTLVSVLFFVSPLYGETIEIVVANYPPITTEKMFEGIGYGMHADFVIATIKKAGHTPRFHWRPFKRKLIEFGRKKFVYIATSKKTLGGIGVKPEVLNYIGLGKIFNHYFYFKSHIGKEVEYSQPTDLVGYKVCVRRGSYVVPSLKKAGVHVEEVNALESCLKKLVRKRNDIWGSTLLTANYYTRKLFPDKLDDLSHNAITPKSTDEMVLAAFKGNPQSAAMIKQLDAAFT